VEDTEIRNEGQAKGHAVNVSLLTNQERKPHIGTNYHFDHVAYIDSMYYLEL